jgi:hypothetical protein
MQPRHVQCVTSKALHLQRAHCCAVRTAAAAAVAAEHPLQQPVHDMPIKAVVMPDLLCLPIAEESLEFP